MKHRPFYGTGTTTLEPDGTATGCNPVEAGSTPAGVSRTNVQPGTSASIQLAQWVEHQNMNLEVDGSIPLLKTLTRTLPRLFESTRDSHVNPGAACYAVDDGPKVAMPGDRLVNGAGVSRR